MNSVLDEALLLVIYIFLLKNKATIPCCRLLLGGLENAQIAIYRFLNIDEVDQFSFALDTFLRFLDYPVC